MTLPLSIPSIQTQADSSSADLSDIAKVAMLEEEMLRHEQVEIPLAHYFSDGVCARQITIPAGTLITGRIHKYENINILSGGEMTVLTHEGMKRIKAPFTIVSPPGTKRIAYTHSECTWTTILVTNERDPDKLEEIYTVGTEKEFLEFMEAQKLIGKV